MIGENKARKQRTRRVLVCGAGSAVGRAFAEARAERGDRLALMDTDGEDLHRQAADLRLRFGADVSDLPFDPQDPSSEGPAVEKAVAAMSGVIDELVFCQGLDLTPATDEDGGAVALSAADADRMVAMNFASLVRVTQLVLPHLPSPGGVVGGLSASAGVRGLRARPVYSASKAGMMTYFEGLRAARLGDLAVCVVVPGPVRAGEDPQAVAATHAAVLDRAMRQRKAVTYTPWHRGPMTAVIRLVPGVIYSRLPL